MGAKKVKTNEKVYYSSTYCDDCNSDGCGECCQNCLSDLNEGFYSDFRKIAPKADKILIVAYNSNWQGKTGYLIIDFNVMSLQTLIAKTSSFSKKIYREGRNMFGFATSHDVPQGSKWLIKPICSNGVSNDILIQKARKLYD